VYTKDRIKNERKPKFDRTLSFQLLLHQVTDIHWVRSFATNIVISNCCIGFVGEFTCMICIKKWPYTSFLAWLLISHTQSIRPNFAAFNTFYSTCITNKFSINISFFFSQIFKLLLPWMSLVFSVNIAAAVSI